MKKFFLLVFSCIAMQFAMAQYVTPGNGTTYTLNDLVTVSNGTVQFVEGNYLLTANLTITSPDVFSIAENATVVCNNGTRIYVQGQAQINPPTEILFISADTTNLSNPFINLYLTENSDNSVIRNLCMKFCCGLKISDAQNVLVENCTFYKNQYKSTHGSGAITLSDCSPIIRNCTFIENVRSAVSSPTNGSVTPTIEGCYMYHNVTGNNNMPQINLGPGNSTDTVKILNNYIEGHVNMSGGISLATMMGGTIIAIVEGNEIVGNRYGINQYGNNITMFARNNQLIDNNLETNPMNGGSGITVYSTTQTTKLYATGNYISGNLWGITLVGGALANLGNLDGAGIEYNIGQNILIDNVNEGVEYNLYNNTASPQMAQGNYWGFATAEESEAVIWHQPDIASLGLVTYAPIWVPATCLGGTKTIPGDYATLEEAVTALNGAEICEGGVTFVLQDGTTYNTAPLTITATGTETSPIIFTNSETGGEKPIINVTATADAQAAFKLMGSDYVTFNNLKITAANEMLDYGIALLPENGTNGCQYNTISNCEIVMTKAANNTNGIYTFCDQPSAVTGSNSFNHFFNNNISNCYIALNMLNDQANSLYFDEANMVYATELGLSEYSNLMMCGVYAKGQKGFKVYNNIVDGVNETTASTNPAGMSFVDDNPSEDLFQYTYEVYNNVIQNVHSGSETVYGIYFSARKTNAHLFNNIIRDVKTMASDNSTANGITIIASSTVVDFYNNMLSDISAAGCAVSNAPATRGIVISTSGSVNLYYNTVVLDYTATNAAHQCAPIFIHGNTTPYLLQNNIFANYVTLPEGSTGRVVAYFKRNNTLNTDYINTLCNNNLYYAGTPSENHLVFYGHNSSSPLIDQTIETFKTRMAAVSPNLEQNSISVNPPFVNTLSDVHIVTNEPTPIAHGGIPVEGITTDIDGNLRNETTPDIGADEFSSDEPSCLISTLPHFEGFEGDYPTECWSMVYGDGAGTVNPMMHTTSKFYEGTKSYRFASMDETSDYNQYLISPEISLESGFMTTFQYAKHTYGTELFRVGYSLNSNDVMSSDFVWGETVTANSVDWSLFEMMMPAGTKYIAIHYASNYQYYLFIDALQLVEPPSCPKPTNLVAAPTATTATLSWLENGTATSWNIEYGVDGFTPGAGTQMTVTENPCTISGLSANTVYDFCVQSICGEGETGEWNCGGSFTTLCESFTAPFEEAFTATTFPLECWSKMVGLASEAFAGINPAPSTSTTSNNWNRVTYSCGLTAEHAKINIYGLDCKSWMVTPNITLLPNSVLQFDAAFTKYASSETSTDCGSAPTGDISDDKFMVIISTDGGNTWNEENATVWMGDDLLQISESGTRLTVNLSSYSGDVRIAFYGESTQNGGDNDLHIDNVFVGTASGCEAPTNLEAEAELMDIHLTWTAPVTRTELLVEDFESVVGDALPDGWIAIDADADGYNWYGVNDGQIVGHSGTGVASSASWIGPVLYPDNWLISPQVALTAGCTLNYWVNAQDASYAADHYGVYVSTTGTSPSDFTLLFEETLTAKMGDGGRERGENAQGQWYERTIDLSDYSGNAYIAFRHFNCSNQFRINIDDVRVFDASTARFNIYRDGTLLAENVTTIYYTDQTTEEGEFCYTVTTVCGDEESEASNEACATSIAPECTAPTNLIALDNGNNINLTWEPSPLAVSYKVYTNGYMLSSGITDLSYTDMSLGAGTYCYTVKAVCAYGESDHSNEACATIESAECNPPQNLEVISNDNNITLTWEEPFLGKEWISWSGEPNTAVGTGTQADFSVAHRYEVSDLTSYDGLQLTKIRFVPYVEECEYSIRVWVGGDIYSPEEMIVDQVVTQDISIYVWNEVVLNTPITLDADKELWIGYRCNTQIGTPAGCDAGPQVAGKGNMMFFNGAWEQMNNLAPTLTYNWCIKGLINTADGKVVTMSPLVDESKTNNTMPLIAVSKNTTTSKATSDNNLKYDIYRDGNLLVGGITDLTYIDSDLPEGHYCYTVVAVCDDGDSDPSNEACDDINSINEMNDTFKLFPNPANNSVAIEGENIESITIYNALGQMVENISTVSKTVVEINTTAYESGVYLFRIVHRNGTTSSSSKRVIIAH